MRLQPLQGGGGQQHPHQQRQPQLPGGWPPAARAFAAALLRRARRLAAGRAVAGVPPSGEPRPQPRPSSNGNPNHSLPAAGLAIARDAGWQAVRAGRGRLQHRGGDLGAADAEAAVAVGLCARFGSCVRARGRALHVLRRAWCALRGAPFAFTKSHPNCPRLQQRAHSAPRGPGLQTLRRDRPPPRSYPTPATRPRGVPRCTSYWLRSPPATASRCRGPRK